MGWQKACMRIVSKCNMNSCEFFFFFFFFFPCLHPQYLSTPPVHLKEIRTWSKKKLTS